MLKSFFTFSISIWDKMDDFLEIGCKRCHYQCLGHCSTEARLSPAKTTEGTKVRLFVPGLAGVATRPPEAFAEPPAARSPQPPAHPPALPPPVLRLYLRIRFLENLN